MKKILKLIPLFLVMALVGCNSSNNNVASEPTETQTEIAINITDVTNEIVSSGCFADQMAETTYIEMLLGIPETDYENAVLYAGGGATAERVVIFEATDNTGALNLKEKCQSHITEQIDAYASYLPAEVDKLNNAIIKTSGKYTLLCVANDYAKANEIINKYFN